MRSSLHQSHVRRIRRRLVPTTLALTLLAAVALPSSAQAAAFKIVPHIANHTPIVNKNWPISLTITRGKMKLSGTVKYEFLFEGGLVSTQPKHGAYKFRNGVYRDKLLFPSDSLNEPLTLRFVVTTKYGTEHIDWKVTAQQ